MDLNNCMPHDGFIMAVCPLAKVTLEYPFTIIILYVSISNEFGKYIIIIIITQYTFRFKKIDQIEVDTTYFIH